MSLPADIVEKARSFRQRVLTAEQLAEEARTLAAEAKTIAESPGRP